MNVNVEVDEGQAVSGDPRLGSGGRGLGTGHQINLYGNASRRFIRSDSDSNLVICDEELLSHLLFAFE
ncbi:unnamed protein product [Danaus chrysippus]|uniref:(African queen) hypothetical protein n=1 Tax=Danaus chrysippus TaxID=151541 RepID=A0A8J2W9M1_9NEOP|nr:unnamed protein product [Danaus chrysippus]